jgi:hypothetical protein
VQEHLFREFLAAVCEAVGGTLDEHTWLSVWRMVEWSESDARTVNSCVQRTWAGCVLAGQAEARCEFSFESVASWVLVRVEVADELEPTIREAMLSAQRGRE